MDTIDIIENGSMVIGNDGSIVAVGTDADIAAKFGSASFDTIVDAKGKAVLPGLVDGHTHPVWSGDRVHEFAMKLAGATYMDIHKLGGGIGFTVRHVHESSEDELLALLLARLDRMLKFGTTVIDAKSGYGLDTANELKLLRVLHKAKSLHPIDLVSNYCGGHSVPKGSTAAQATADIVNNQIPALVASNQRGETSAELIDVFMEKGVFEAADTRTILEAGKKAGLHANFHGDELSYTAAAELAGDIGAMAVSHLEWVSDDGIKKMAEKDVAAVLLPTTAYILRVHPPPARKMIENNVIVALGSDFNPNAHCMSLPMVMNLACVLMRMTMKEALNACTINAAASVNRSSSHGTLEAGKHGDFIVLNAPNWEHLIYQIADPPIEAVYRKGKLVFATPAIARQSA